MFKRKKELKKLEEKRKELEKEKQELLFIKQQLNDNSPKIDISNVYIWKYKDIYSLVYLNEKEILGIDIVNRERNGYSSTLTDIFSDEIVYKKSSLDRIQAQELITNPRDRYSSYAFLYSIYEYDKNLLAFTDKKVPKYLLQQLLFKLNNVNVDSYTLKKICNKKIK